MLSSVATRRKIYIVSSEGRSGGPTSLHMLANTLKGFGVDVYMVYFARRINSFLEKGAYEHNIPIVTSIEDSPDNILVVPEIYANLLGRFRNIRKAIWWLSFDNYFFTIEGWRGKLNNTILHKFGFYLCGQLDDDIWHLAQGNYVYRRLLKLIGDPSRIDLLETPMDEEFLMQEVSLGEKEDLIVYNPSKGVNFIRRVITKFQRVMPGVSVIPLEGFSKEELVDILRRSKVFLQFGYFPGRERLPREAVLLGNVLLLGGKGAVWDDVDFPIDRMYKFHTFLWNIPSVVDMLKKAVVYWDKFEKDFDKFRSVLRNQKSVFLKQVKRIFAL